MITRNEKILAYTVAIDRKESNIIRAMTKLLASSITRTCPTVDFVIFSNFTRPVFEIERRQVTEYAIDTVVEDSKESVNEGWSMKYRVAPFLDVSDYDVVLYLDCDCLVLRDISYLFSGDLWHLMYQPESQQRGYLPQFHSSSTSPGEPLIRGANSGTCAFRASEYHRLANRWQELAEQNGFETFCFEQVAWNSLVREEYHLAQCFEASAVMFPLAHDPCYLDYCDATILHFVGDNVSSHHNQKLALMYGVYQARFALDEIGIVLDISEP